MEYAIMFRGVLNSMRGNLEFCDGTITSSDNKRYDVHRIVLCGESEVLAKLYQDADKDNNTAVYVDIRSSILEDIVEALYSGEFPSNPEELITWSNINEFFQAAKLLALTELEQLCLDFVDVQMKKNNCYIHDFYREISSNKAYEHEKKVMKDIIIANFPRVNNKWEFSGDDLIEILNDEFLNTISEEEVLQVVEEWIFFNSNNRDEYLLKLCRCIRIDQLKSPEESFKQIAEMKGSYKNIQGTLKCPRVPYHLIFVQGGWHSLYPISDMEIFDIRTNTWAKETKQTPFVRSYHSLVGFDKRIFVIGGFDGKKYFRSVACYDPIENSWCQKSCMEYKRCYLSSCASGDYLYALGGFNGFERLSSVERYDPKINQWQLLAPMSTQRSDASSCAVGNQIIIAGGFDGYAVLRTVESLDITTWQWTTLRNMNTRRSGLSLVFASNGLYAIGGFDGFTRLATLEKYSFRKGRWIKKDCDMINGRSNFGCVSLGDTIYVIGGFEGISTVTHCESFNIHSKKWTELPDIPTKRSAIGACSVHGLDSETVKEQLGRYSTSKTKQIMHNLNTNKYKTVS